MKNYKMIEATNTLKTLNKVIKVKQNRIHKWESFHLLWNGSGEVLLLLKCRLTSIPIETFSVFDLEI